MLVVQSRLAGLCFSLLSPNKCSSPKLSLSSSSVLFLTGTNKFRILVRVVTLHTELRRLERLFAVIPCTLTART